MDRIIESVQFTIDRLENFNMENLDANEVIYLDDALIRLREYVNLLGKINEATIGMDNTF